MATFSTANRSTATVTAPVDAVWDVLTEPDRIDFTHDPAPGADESAGVVGWYALSPRPAGTHLETSMEITVDLPFPGLLRPAVTTAMKGVVALMGQRFSHNLLAHLGATTA